MMNDRTPEIATQQKIESLMRSLRDQIQKIESLSEQIERPLQRVFAIQRDQNSTLSMSPKIRDNLAETANALVHFANTHHTLLPDTQIAIIGLIKDVREALTMSNTLQSDKKTQSSNLSIEALALENYTAYPYTERPHHDDGGASATPF